MKPIGICFGGYCPLHRGHLDVIMTAKKQCDHVFVVVCGYDNEPRGNEIGLNLDKRYALIKKFFKNDEQIKVIKINDTKLGIDESMSEHNWKVWTDEVVNKINNEYWSNANFSKEYFAFYVAEKLYEDSLQKIGYNTVYIPRINPISGTEIRNNPIKWFNQIARTFQPYFVKNILIIGTASEGKTTLVNDISKYFNIPKTVEYGRVYMEERNITDIDLVGNDFHQFISGQYDEYKKAVEQSTCGFTIQDTDNLVTLMYAKAYVEDPNININQNDYKALYQHAKSINKYFKWDHIFVVCPNNPNFVDDGCRYMKQASLYERIKNMDKLNQLIYEFYGAYQNNITYLVGGDFLTNFNTVKDYINSCYEV